MNDIERLLQEILENLKKVNERLERQQSLGEFIRITQSPEQDLSLNQEQIKGCLDGCEFPTHYYSPDGDISCMKCGRTVKFWRPIYSTL